MAPCSSASSSLMPSGGEGRLGETGLRRVASWDSFDGEEEAGEEEGERPSSDSSAASSLPVSIANSKRSDLPPVVAAVTDEANVLAMLSSSPASARAFADVAAKGAALAERVGGKVKLVEGRRVLYVRATNGVQQ